MWGQNENFTKIDLWRPKIFFKLLRWKNLAFVEKEEERRGLKKFSNSSEFGNETNFFLGCIFSHKMSFCFLFHGVSYLLLGHQKIRDSNIVFCSVVYDFGMRISKYLGPKRVWDIKNLWSKKFKLINYQKWWTELKHYWRKGYPSYRLNWKKDAFLKEHMD